MSDDSLPQDWEMRPLGDCVEKLKSGKRVERGWSPQCLNHPTQSNEDWGVLKTTAVQMGEYQPEHHKALPSNLEPKRGLEVGDGDFLLTTTGPRSRCGVVCLARNTPKKLIFSGKILRFRADEKKVSASWLESLMMSPVIQSTFDSLKVGTSDSSVSIGNRQVLDLQIPVPPLQEQKRIVEILEEQLSRLDAAVKSVQTVREKAAQFRRSLLHAVFFGSDRTEWRTLPLEDALEFSIGGVWGEGPGESEVDVEVVRVTELRPHGMVDTFTAVRRSITQKQLESRALKPGDLVLEKSGGGPNTPVGRVGKIIGTEHPTVCSNFMQLMRPDIEAVRPSFLHHFLVFFHSDGKTIPLQTATTNIRNIKTKDYLKTLIPVPSLDEQDEIVPFLEEQLSRLDATLAVADEVERKANALRRSLLHAAFTGELTRSWREAHV